MPYMIQLTHPALNVPGYLEQWPSRREGHVDLCFLPAGAMMFARMQDAETFIAERDWNRKHPVHGGRFASIVAWLPFVKWTYGPDRRVFHKNAMWHCKNPMQPTHTACGVELPPLRRDLLYTAVEEFPAGEYTGQPWYCTGCERVVAMRGYNLIPGGYTVRYRLPYEREHRVAWEGILHPYTNNWKLPVFWEGVGA